MPFSGKRYFGLLMKHWFAALGVLIFITPGLLLLNACCDSDPKSQQELLPSGAKAAIIDQLSPLYPNEDFILATIDDLENYGFQVDVFNGDEITVDFYRTLPSHDYRLIILRAHSGLLGVDPNVTNKTWLFTNETYSQTLHVSEQLVDRLTYGKITESNPWLFTINAAFIRESMQGEFNRTVIIMMGCDGLRLTDLAKAFVEKGASVYIGWDAPVGLNYVDRATGILLNELCSERLSIASAVVETMNKAGADPEHGAKLKYYPIPGDYKLLYQLFE